MLSDAPGAPRGLRGFSAPVRLRFEPPLDDEGLALLAAHDTDEFNRWEAGQELGARVETSIARSSAVASERGVRGRGKVSARAPSLSRTGRRRLGNVARVGASRIELN